MRTREQIEQELAFFSLRELESPIKASTVRMVLRWVLEIEQSEPSEHWRAQWSRRALRRQESVRRA